MAELVNDAEPWDLLILDEAHHARRKGAGLTKDKKANQLLGLMQRLKDRTSGLVLLTATPMQVTPIEVWDLLDLLGLPPGWDELSFVDFFDKAAHPNPSHADFEFLAEKFRQAEAHFGAVSVDSVSRFLPGGSAPDSSISSDAVRPSGSCSRRRRSLVSSHAIRGSCFAAISRPERSPHPLPTVKSTTCSCR
jgi:hypothetical protein